MGFDARELRELSQQIKSGQQDWDRLAEDCIKELAARLLRKVIKRTPVGQPPKFSEPKTIKVKGSYGGNQTFLTKSGAILDQHWNGYQGGTLRKAWSIGEIIKQGNMYKIEVINPTEYASYVEFGHRQQPGKYVPAIGKQLKKGWVEGRFMLTISEKDIQAKAPQILEYKIRRELSKYFNDK